MLPSMPKGEILGNMLMKKIILLEKEKHGNSKCISHGVVIDGIRWKHMEYVSKDALKY